MALEPAIREEYQQKLRQLAAEYPVRVKEVEPARPPEEYLSTNWINAKLERIETLASKYKYELPKPPVKTEVELPEVAEVREAPIVESAQNSEFEAMRHRQFPCLSGALSSLRSTMQRPFNPPVENFQTPVIEANEMTL